MSVTRPIQNGSPSRRDTLLGIAFMTGAFFCYAVSDMFAKLLTEDLHPIQVAWTRQLGLSSVVIALLLRHGGAFFGPTSPFCSSVVA